MIGTSKTQAAIKAGYSKKTAERKAYLIFKRPAVQEYIQKRMEELQDEKVASQTEVIEYLTAVMRGESRAHALTTDWQGEGVGKPVVISKPPSELERLKAGELLGKRYGLFKDNTNITLEPITIVDDVGD